MDLLLKINEWFKLGRPYAIGANILAQCVAEGFNSTFLILCQGPKSSYSSSKLESELSRIQEVLKKQTAAESPKKYYGAIDTGNLPDDLKELYEKAILNLKAIDRIKGQLREVYYDENGNHRKAPDTHRGNALIHDLHSRFQQNTGYWARIDHYKQYKQYLPGTEPVVLTIDRCKYLLSMQVKVVDYLTKTRLKIKRNEGYNKKLFDEYEALEREIKNVING